MFLTRSEYGPYSISVGISDVDVAYACLVNYRSWSKHFFTRRSLVSRYNAVFSMLHIRMRVQLILVLRAVEYAIEAIKVCFAFTKQHA